jgi:copper(I)-binding protein
MKIDRPSRRAIWKAFIKMLPDNPKGDTMVVGQTASMGATLIKNGITHVAGAPVDPMLMYTGNTVMTTTPNHGRAFIRLIEAAEDQAQAIEMMTLYIEKFTLPPKKG